MKKYIFLILVFLSVAVVSAQEKEGSKTLFPYPQAPDTISSFQERANYVVSRFWDSFDFSKPIKDEAAFDGAFRDYIVFFPHAHKTIVLNSIRNMLNKAQSNKTNFEFLGQVAEKNLYSSQAVFASDEAYMPFVDAMIKSKALDKKQREYYKLQSEKIKRNAIGAPCPELVVEGLNGEKHKLSEILSDTLTMLFFNDGQCEDCLINRLRLCTNEIINNMISKGELKIVCIYPKKYSKEWAQEAKEWASNWTIVASEDAYEVFDVRIYPAIFVIDKDKKLADKNVAVEMILR